MGFIRWIKGLLGFGSPPAPKCNVCGRPFRTLDQEQCWFCGTATRSPSNPLDLPRSVSQSSPLSPPSSSQGALSWDNVLNQPQPRPAPKTLADLELGTFKPMTSEEAKQEAQGYGASLRGNGWFGRRDLIPPTSDPRTLIIDRAMVGQGLITPEELAEIHQVGLTMDELRPDLLRAHSIAGAAVQEAQADREKLKQQKKAEAIEKKKRHAEGVAQRRRTDIVYLGRGVSRGLADRRSNIERLQAQQLPVLSTPADVAQAIGISIPKLRWLAFHAETATRTHYVTFTVSKRSGGQRTLAAPHQSLRQCQEWILNHVLVRVPTHESAHGFVSSRSTVTNAVPHVGQDIVLNADLENFFPSISFARVKGVFRGMGYSPAVATIFALLCTECPRQTIQYSGTTYHVATGPRGLPQGACTSPALSNLVARRLDRRLNGIAQRLGWTYTRYADDLTLSASGEAAGKIGYILARLRHIAADERFVVNEKKTRTQRRNQRQSVTAIVVNDKPNVPRDLIRRIRAILHRAQFEGLKPQNREGRPNFESWLEGMIAYIQMVNPQQGGRLRADFDKLSVQRASGAGTKLV